MQTAISFSVTGLGSMVAAAGKLPIPGDSDAQTLPVKRDRFRVYAQLSQVSWPSSHSLLLPAGDLASQLRGSVRAG